MNTNQALATFQYDTISQFYHRRGAEIAGTLCGIDTADACELRSSLQHHPLVCKALQELQRGLPEGLYYHNTQHTLSVIEATLRYAQQDGLSSRDLELLAIAAAWHDVGYTVQRHRNEPIGSAMAEAAMRRVGGYTDSEVADVVSAILATEVVDDPASASLVQKARGRLSPWLLDGDLSNFGSKDFFSVSLKLLRELSGFEVVNVEELQNPLALKFVASTLRMLHTHEYQTDAARLLLSRQKELSVRKLGYLLAQLISGTELSRRNAWDALMCLE